MLICVIFYDAQQTNVTDYCQSNGHFLDIFLSISDFFIHQNDAFFMI